MAETTEAADRTQRDQGTQRDQRKQSTEKNRPAHAPGPVPEAAQGAADPAVTAGVAAPPFELADQHGAPVSLHGVLRERAALVMFYPFAFSSICGSELRELRDALPEFTAAGVQPMCVSCDPIYTLRVYADQEGFGFPLLSDFWPHGGTARSYGVFEADRGCALRGSFLVDRAGTVRWSIVNPLREPRPIAGTVAALALAES